MDIKSDTIIFDGLFGYKRILLLPDCDFVILSIYDDNAVIRPFNVNNNHKVLLWYSWYHDHYMNNDEDAIGTAIDLLFSQSYENYSHTFQEINTIIYYKNKNSN